MAIAAATTAWAQAVVNENLETATLYVDAVKGNDGNPGTQSQPFQTIGAGLSQAITNNKAGTGTLVIVNPGTYREVLSASQTSRDTTLPITLQAATPGTVIISGGQVFTGWTPYASNPAIYTNAWPYDWGLCVPTASSPDSPDIVLRREMVFVNSQPMTQVLSLSQVQYPGTFFVDEVGGTIYLWPPVGTNPATATVEVATQPTLLSVNSRDYMVFRGLTFQYANSCRDSGAVTVAGSVTNVIFDNDVFVWNNSLGLQISAPLSNFTIENSSALHNGESGFQATQTLNGLWQNNVASYNNWRGAQGSYFAWNSGGFHFFQAHNDTITGATMAYNQTHGIHWDTDQYNITTSGLQAYNNVLNGLMVEASEGPVSIDSATVCANDVAVHDSYNFQGGLLLRNSTNVSLTNSLLYDNGPGQINLQGQKGGLVETNWQTGQSYNLITSNLTLSGNTIYAPDGTQTVFSDSYLVDGDWTTFVTTLSSDNNTWYNPADTTNFVVPSPNSGAQDTLGGWQALTGQDANSVWVQPPDPTNTCNVPADGPDYWLISSTGAPSIGIDGTATITETVVPIGGMTGTVSLAPNTSSIPGLTATMTPSSVTLDGMNNATATVTFTASTTLAAGTYDVPVLANLGSVTRTSTVLLTVPQTSVRLSTTSLTFGSQTIGTSSDPQNVTLTNIGSSALTITSIATGKNFSQTNTCGSTLGAGKSCTISVTFVPTQGNNVNGTLTITDSDGTSSPQTVNLSGTGLARPMVTFTPGTLAFQTIAVGANRTLTATLTNASTGTSVLAISNIFIAGSNPSQYSQTNNCPATLAAGASCTVTVTFAPTSTGSLPATLSVSENSNSGQHNVNLTGTGTTTGASVSYSPSSVSFPDTMVGSSAATQTITVTNTDGSNTLNLNSVTLGGTNPGDFTLTNGCGSTLKRNKTCTFTVGFVPTVAGSRSASIIVVDSANPSTQTIDLTGNGTSPTVTVALAPASLNFGTITNGSTAPPQLVTITNTSPTAALSVSNVTLSGANKADFAATNTCPASLAAGLSCTVSVTFTPSFSGSRTATMTITDNVTAGGTQTVSLSGTGSSTVPTATLTPSSLSFGNLALGSTITLTTSLKNTSASVPLLISSITLTGANPGDYSLSNTCPASLAAGTTCTITATFTPTTTGTRTANISVASNVSGGTQTVSLTGTGVTATPTVTVSPASVNFGNVAVGSSSPTNTVVLTNTSVSASLTLTSVALGGANASQFTMTNTCGSSLLAAQSCTVMVTFKPTVSGAAAATITFTDNANPTTQTVSLSGTGVVPTATLTPASLTFASQTIGTTSASQTATLTNTSTTVSLSITSVALGGANAGDFALTNSCGATLAAGANCRQTLTFTPTAAGTRTATLTVTDNASPTTQTITLTGTGTTPTPTVTVTPSTLTYAATAVGTTSASQTVTITNTSTNPNATLNLTSVALSGSNAADYALTNSCGATVAAGASCTVSLTFTPAAAGTRTATLTVTDNASPTTQTVALTGTGAVPTVTVTPSTLTFAGQNIGTTSASQTITVTNTSAAVTLSLGNITVTGANAADFGETDTCGATLAAGANCKITITFTPTAAGTRTATVTVNDNASPATQTVSLTGTGVNPVPTVTVSPGTLSFGSFTLGTSSLPMTVTITNTSASATLNITSLALSGANATDYPLTNLCGATLAAGASCTATVVYTPLVAGSSSATLTITDDASPTTQTVSLSGTGVAPIPTVSVSPSILRFGTVTVGSKSAPQTVTITNTSTDPNAVLNLSSISVIANRAYSQTNTCPATLAAGASCSVSIIFIPPATGFLSNTLTVIDNAVPGVQTVSLTGTGG